MQYVHCTLAKPHKISTNPKFVSVTGVIEVVSIPLANCVNQILCLFRLFIQNYNKFNCWISFRCKNVAAYAWVDSISLFIPNKQNETLQQKCQAETRKHLKTEYYVFIETATSIDDSWYRALKATSGFIWCLFIFNILRIT